MRVEMGFSAGSVEVKVIRSDEGASLSIQEGEQDYIVTGAVPTPELAAVLREMAEFLERKS